jgi:hypothetical protein
MGENRPFSLSAMSQVTIIAYGILSFISVDNDLLHMLENS